MSRLILGTAGHIDHGKTALVQALTGVDTDRLPEEKQRGITIDLGFANLQLGEHSFGVVDVPGHEGFIRNMLAGATGMDVVLLVVAADEGIMPQTREHLAILDLLGVRAGVAAITKSDLAQDEWIQLVSEEVRELLQSTSLRDAPVIAVSARTGSGLAELREALVQQATQPAARNADDRFRMPIDRVFTVRGTGTVVTGTVWTGTLRVDDTVLIEPSGAHARVRAIQHHGETATCTRAGQRAAIALSGVDRTAIERGHTVVKDAWSAATMLTIHARMIAGTDWSLEPRQRIRVSIGTAEVLARVALLDRERLAPGDAGWIQLRLEQPVIARAGDRVVVRAYSPVTTIGGGIVAELSTRKRGSLDEGTAAQLGRIIAGDARAAVRAAIQLADERGASIEELTLATGLAADVVEKELGDVVTAGTRIFAAEVVERTIDRLLAALRDKQADQPLRPHYDRAELLSALRGLPEELATHALTEAAVRGTIVAESGGIRLAGHRPTLTARQVALKASLLERLTDAGLAAPTATELGKSMADPAEVIALLRILEGEGLVRCVAPGLYLEEEALANAEARTRRELGGAQDLAAAQFRATVPVSRKHLIPLLEYFDRTGLTVRTGELRSVPDASERD